MRDHQQVRCHLLIVSISNLVIFSYHGRSPPLLTFISLFDIFSRWTFKLLTSMLLYGVSSCWTFKLLQNVDPVEYLSVCHSSPPACRNPRQERKYVVRQVVLQVNWRHSQISVNPEERVGLFYIVFSISEPIHGLLPRADARILWRVLTGGARPKRDE
ncbi:hypothetical protein TNIN_95211 [Trichonephila inaurata madagascariensis]|uniref:Uncharacterized protein n=1 Tax=Trichonephila inaurata madagascariensis TaxID=2747483 RepID=A0A8X6J4Y4_9ARAC|nr:hypothetical protein TNIN_95211 [Trichonephila inaurata madagascariensis]